MEVVEYVVVASYLPKQDKLPYLKKATLKLDVLKFFLQVAWEIKALDTKKYITLSDHVDEIGRMQGGWIKQLSQENPPFKKSGK